ncbi:MAG: 30S ribosomal protein S8e, partial [Candidatus Aenigmarchaeota archaeon]|nr:30S ribosomal protein S8e [Candidatus Aenigmarchaeota archaeon]
DVLENKANPHFIRQKLLTKGAVVKTDAGKVKITSRPAQDGVVNGVVVE